MIKAECIDKFRDKNGVIIGYLLKDIMTGGTTKIASKELKAAMYNQQVDVINLKLTSDGKLIDHKKSKESDNEISAACMQLMFEPILSSVSERKMSILPKTVEVDNKKTGIAMGACFNDIANPIKAGNKVVCIKVGFLSKYDDPVCRIDIIDMNSGAILGSSSELKNIGDLITGKTPSLESLTVMALEVMTGLKEAALNAGITEAGKIL